MTTNQAAKIPCAHYASTYLPLTENWIYRSVINLKKYSPVFLCRQKKNLELFPLAGIYSLDDYGTLRQLLEIAFFKVSGYFHFFYRVLKKDHTKILHVHFGYHGVKLAGLKKKLKIPMICSFYGDDVFAHPRKGNNARKYVRLFSELDKALVLGPYMKAELIRLGCPEQKIAVHHLGIDVDAIHFVQRKVTPGDKIRFLIASSFLQKKGIDLAIKALAHFNNRYDFTLDIIGDGPLKNDLLQVIEASGIKDRITLHGYKPYDYFINLTYRADVFIQASLTTKANNKEGTPMAIVDAMAAGMAIVSTRHSDIPEIVTADEQGYLAEENNLESLISCFARVFSNPEKIETFSLNARAKVEQEFNARIQALRLERYYDEVIQAK